MFNVLHKKLSTKKQKTVIIKLLIAPKPFVAGGIHLGGKSETVMIDLTLNQYD